MVNVYIHRAVSEQICGNYQENFQNREVKPLKNKLIYLGTYCNQIAHLLFPS